MASGLSEDEPVDKAETVGIIDVGTVFVPD